MHLHSNLSDGLDSPEELVDLAKKAGLKTISLTDHDNVDGIERAQRRGAEVGVEVIPGIEFTCEIPRAEVHILGYFIDFKDPELLQTLKKIQEDRVKRIYKIVEKLRGLGVGLSPEDVFSISGKKAPGRPHVARALIAKGHVSNFKEAFIRYLDFRAPAYVSHYKLTPSDAVKLIAKAGGVPVFAHPVISNCDEIIPGLTADGLAGIEVYYPGYDEQQIKKYTTIAKKFGLLVTGGSDFHGLESGREAKLGDIAIPDEYVDKLKDEYLRRNKS